MKNLSLISFVGIDVHTNLDDLLKFKVRTPLEFSVLFSDTKSQTNDNRYPDYDFCKEFLKWGMCLDGDQVSLHLCGSVIERYLNKEPGVMALADLSARIQLNLNIHSYPDHEELTERIISCHRDNGHNIILQQNKTKKKFMETFFSKNTLHLSVLHDGSGGFGKEIAEVQPPYENENYFTGYAGGLKPENVKRVVDLIESKNVNNKEYYIDMESGVRTDNVFSVEKCQQVINELE